MIDKDYLKEYKKILRNFSNKFNYDQKTIQRAIEGVIAYTLGQGGTLSTTDLVNLASPTDSLLHDIFDWSKSPSDREIQAENILNSISIFISSNNKIFKIEKI